MILQASLAGGWEKLDLWGHTHLTLLALLMLVCVLEVVLLKTTTSARLFARPHPYDLEYDDSGEYEEDIYYEELANHYNPRARRQLRFRHRHRDTAGQGYNLSNDEDNQFTDTSSYHPASSDVFRFVY